jgi:hypothetical protein
MGLPDELAFATKGELAVQILTDACADGMVTDFMCGDGPAVCAEGWKPQWPVAVTCSCAH